MANLIVGAYMNVFVVNNLNAELIVLNQDILSPVVVAGKKVQTINMG